MCGGSASGSTPPPPNRTQQTIPPWDDWAYQAPWDLPAQAWVNPVGARQEPNAEPVVDPQKPERWTGRWDNKYGNWEKHATTGEWELITQLPEPKEYDKKYKDKSPPPEWDGKNPESTWKDYKRLLKQWLVHTDIPPQKQGHLVWRALKGEAKVLVYHITDEQMSQVDGAEAILKVLEENYRYATEFEDQEDFEKVLYGLQRERNQTLLQFANVARASFLKADRHGHPLSDRHKGMIFLRKAKIAGPLEEHILSRTNGSRNFTDVHAALRVLARRPISGASENYPGFEDAEDDSYDYWPDDDESEPEYEDYPVYDEDGEEMIDIGELDIGEFYDEEVLEWALANYREQKSKGKGKGPTYKQSRKSMNDAKLSRGWVDKSKDGKGKRSGKGGKKGGKGKTRQYRSISELKARTACKACGKIGH